MLLRPLIAEACASQNDQIYAVPTICQDFVARCASTFHSRSSIAREICVNRSAVPASPALLAVSIAVNLVGELTEFFCDLVEELVEGDELRALDIPVGLFGLEAEIKRVGEMLIEQCDHRDASGLRLIVGAVPQSLFHRKRSGKDAESTAE
jgi:hypothetical protein